MRVQIAEAIAEAMEDKEVAFRISQAIRPLRLTEIDEIMEDEII